MTSTAVAAEPRVLAAFVAGASSSGRIEAARGAKIALDGVELSLTADGTHRTTRSNARGFFQFKGLPPGDYALRARRQGLVARATPVTIRAGFAAELSEPLLLDRPKRLSVTLAPALDPELKPWRVTVSSRERSCRSRSPRRP